MFSIVHLLLLAFKYVPPGICTKVKKQQAAVETSVVDTAGGGPQTDRIQFKGSKLLFYLEILYMLSKIEIDFSWGKKFV